MRIQNNINCHILFNKIFILNMDHIKFIVYHIFNIHILFQDTINQ